MFTITESFQPVAIMVGESINKFFRSLTKDLSYYQCIQLTIVTTSLLMPLLVYLMSFLSLLLFDYEFNFFHIISVKKNKTLQIPTNCMLCQNTLRIDKRAQKSRVRSGALSVNRLLYLVSLSLNVSGHSLESQAQIVSLTNSNFNLSNV